MSQEDTFDWSATPSWSEVFEDEENFSAGPGWNSIPKPYKFRRIHGSPHEGIPLAWIPEDLNEPALEEPTEENARMVIRRSQSQLDQSSASIAIPNSESAMHRSVHQHPVPGSVPMQFSSSLPTPDKPLQLEPSPAHQPNVIVRAKSNQTGVVISELLSAPPLLRSHGNSPPRSEERVRTTPVWAQPPIETACVRGSWGEGMTDAYRSMIVSEFGSVLFHQREGWWQELLKSDNGRIVVKTDNHHYTVICYLPGLTAENVSIYHGTRSLLHIQANCHIQDDHFHWKVELPGAVLKVDSLAARFVGATCTIQVPRRKYQRQLDRDTTESQRRLVDNVDIVPVAIYEPT